MKRTPKKFQQILILLGTIVTSVLLVDAKILDLNEMRVPKTQEDLENIQDALIRHSSAVRAATVSIKIGEGFGSGVIVDAEGLILTAAHVTAGVEKDLTVILNDGTEYKAVSMGLVSDSDAAMMRILVEDSVEVEPFPFVEINRDGDYRLGHWVFALGHSGGFDKERGTVLRLGRIVKDSETTLHTDCKVIGGDSGGPLYDMNGKLIAIHSRVQNSVEQNMHVPMREYLKHWEALSNSEFLGDGPFAERPVKGSGFMGFNSSDTDAGVRIDLLLDDGPADEAGVLVGDIILKMNDEAVSNKAGMKAIMKELAEGDELRLTRDAWRGRSGDHI